jgi:hypothetical protein
MSKTTNKFSPEVRERSVRLVYLGAIAQVSVRRRARGRLAGEDHPAQEAQAGRDRPVQLYGAHRLRADEEQEPMDSGRVSVVSWPVSR